MGKTALLIIDMQNDFCLPGAPFEVKGALSVAAQIKKALDAGRSFGLPIVHVIRHYRADGTDVEITRLQAFMEKGGALIEGTKGAEIIDGLKPVKGEYIVVKKRWSAFFQTELDILLRRLKVNRIVVTGVQTPNCIRATVWDANSLDYEVILLTDGTGAMSPEVHQANLFDMQNIGIELMTTEEFITYLHNLPK
ncbi:MAG: cysteine hydrolase family protein [Pelotomaculaceae bacterium]|jgi:nicotinamidase-related amidase|uniref:Maleamate amidohydrolase n=1 Tax=anaerobic digester metagenome TaxID=1263854 RepID=A0A485M2M4_9ZZZZ|nr:cysteine hydrolase [Peptococcaceae bacterium]